ncbi:MAG: TatD family hydrolase [Fusobacteria bacterium]|nr:TatD family hydrolase [Fusobacteriota bacterium]
MIDSHAHLNDPKLLASVDEVLARAKAVGVSEIIVPGYDLPSSLKAVELAGKYEELYAVVGIHPHEAADYNSEVEAQLKSLLQQDKVVGLGEIGLDYYYDNSPREVQQEVFKKQLKLALEYDLPVVIHSREAFLDTFNILKEQGKGLRGVFHCFSGSLESAKRIIRELGFYISLGGPVTFQKAREPLEVGAWVSLDHLLIETDCPYLAPHPHRGKVNEPSFLPLILAKLEELRGEKIEEITVNNTRKLFGI